MNIVCDKSTLSAAIDGVSKAVTMRSSIPVLEGILLKAEGFQLTLTGYDMEMAITVTIESNVRVAGECVLNAKLLGDMVDIIWPKVESGEIRPTIFAKYPIQQAEEAQALMASGKSAGKIVLTVK